MCVELDEKRDGYPDYSFSLLGAPDSDAQVLMAQELTEKAGQLQQKHVEEGMGARGEELVALHLEKLKEAPRRVAVSCTA